MHWWNCGIFIILLLISLSIYVSFILASIHACNKPQAYLLVMISLSQSYHKLWRW